MIPTCPDKERLSAWIDGELTPAERLVVEEHLQGCAACRSTSRGYVQIDRALRRSAATDGDPEFAVRFRSRLMDRMATSREMRASRRPSLAPVAAAAAGFILSIGLFLLSRDPEAEPAQESREVVRESAPLEPAPAVVLAGLAAASDHLNRDDLAAVDRRLRSRGSSLAGLLSTGLETDAIEARAALKLMAGHPDLRYVAVLKEKLAGGRFLVADRDRAIDLVIELDARAARTLIPQLVKVGLPVEDALNRLLSIEGGTAELVSLARAHAPTAADRVVASLSASNEPMVARLLLELWLEGTQSEALAAELRKRSGLLTATREVAFRGDQSLERTERAVRLLGLFADAESLPRLDRLVTRGRLADSAIDAIAAIGGEESMLTLARHLDVRNRVGDLKLQERLCGRLQGFGQAAARLFLERAALGNDPFERHYVRATGYCGDKAVLPQLVELTRRDELKAHAVEAIARIGKDEARPILLRLANDGDARLRRCALEAIERLEPDRAKRARDGFVRQAEEGGEPPSKATEGALPRSSVAEGSAS